MTRSKFIRQRSIAGSLILAMALSGCAANNLGRAARVDESAALDRAEKLEIQAVMASLTPEEGTATHRVLLSIGRRQFDLNSRLAISRARGLRLVALVSMGQVMMDVWVKPSGETVLMREPLGMRPAWVEGFVARDIAALYRSMLEPGYRFVRLRNGEAAAERAEGDGLVLRHRFNAAGDEWIGSEIIDGDRRVWSAEKRAEAVFDGISEPIPSAVAVAAPRYRLDIQTVAFKLGPPPARLFEMPAEQEDSP